MKLKFTTVAIACVLALGLAAPAAHADTLPTTTMSLYLGSIDPGAPADLTNEAGRINYLIQMSLGAAENDVNIPVAGPGPYDYKRSLYVDPATTTLPLAIAATAATNVTSNVNGNFGTGWTYLLAKFGNVDHVWYVLDQTGDFTLPSETTAKAMGGGLSHYTFFNPGTTSVPDGGVTLILLGGALVGLETLRRKFRA